MLAVKLRTLGDEEKVLEELKAEACRVQKSLTRDVKPALAEAQREESKLTDQRASLLKQLDELAQSRHEATKELGKLSKRQLAEIKQLTRSPPDAIRRTLIAAWLLLHGDRFLGKATITFDEVKDWPRCQKMLADEGFIPNIMNFDLAALMPVPHVPRFVAANFFGMYVQGARVSEGGRGSTPELPSVQTAQAVVSTDEAPSAPQKIQSFRSTVIRTTSKRSSGKTAEKPPLEVDMVAHASEPCGALLKWMLELVREYVERERIEKDIAEVDSKLETVQRCSMKLEGDAAGLEAKLAKVLLAIEQMEQRLNTLRLDKGAAKKAAQDLTKLPSFEVKAVQTRLPKKEKKEVTKEIEVELSGSMGHLEHAVAQLRVHFAVGAANVCSGDAEQAVTLLKIADMVKAQKGSKFLLEGHCESGEREGTDYERCLAVFEWLVEAALCPPGSLRIKGLKSARGEGRCVVIVLIDELVVRSGPTCQELEAAQIQAKPGLFFPSSSSELASESKAILGKMAAWLKMEDDTYVRVEGHTDANEKLALAGQRAQGTAAYLMRLGVAKKQLRVSACGSRHLASRLHDELNRRVELHVD